MTQSRTLYTAAVEVGEEFLGPAGERFMRRQISTHLNIEPEKLQTKHLDKLVDWVRVTFAVLTDNGQHVDDFSERLLALGENATNSPIRGKVTQHAHSH